MEPSPLRLRRALRAGDGPLAPAIGRLFALVVVGLGASAALGVLADRFGERLRLALASPEAVSAQSALWDVFWICAPLLAGAAGVAVVVGLAQTGGVVRLRRAEPGARPGTGKGLASLQSVEPWAAAARAALVVAGLAATLLIALSDGAPEVAATTGDAARALRVALSLSFRFFELALAVLALGAALDFVIRRSAWLARWRPSPGDARRERREQESPEVVRHLRRRRHEEIARSTSNGA